MERLPADHRRLFGAVVERLVRRRRSALPLLEALALARGRGLPRVDRTWLVAARALYDGVRIREQDIDDLLDAAAPYIMLDAQSGQSVYRLAHRTFAEHFLRFSAGHDPAGPAAARHRRITAALIAAAARDLPVPPNPYVSAHLAEHAGEALAWRELTAAGPLLDHLEPGAVAAMVLKHGFGRADVPTELAAFALAHNLMEGASPPDRATIRAVAQDRLNGLRAPGADRGLVTAALLWQSRQRQTDHRVVTTTSRGRRVVAGWAHKRQIFVGFDRDPGPPVPGTFRHPTSTPVDSAVRWTRLRRENLHTALSAHAGPVWTVATLALRDGRTLLASGGDDASVRLWDPLTGSAAGAPLLGHDGPVRAMAAVPLPDGQMLLATGGDDQTVRLWNPVTGQAIGRPLIGHDGPVLCVTAVPFPDGRTLLASGGHDKTVRLWDPFTGLPVNEPFIGHDRPVRSIAVALLPGGYPLLASCSDIGLLRIGREPSLRLWDPVSGAERPDLASGLADTTFFPPRAVASVSMPDGPTLLAITGKFINSAIRLWDPADNPRQRSTVELPFSHDDPEHILTFALPGRRLLVATADGSTIRLWKNDPLDDEPDRRESREIGRPFVDQSGDVAAMAAVPLADGRVLLASASTDGVVRLWDPAAELRRAEVAAEDHAAERSWLLDGVDPGALLVTAVAVLDRGDGRPLLATASQDQTTRLWDAATGEVVGTRLHTQPLPTRPSRANWFSGSAGVAPVPLADGRVALATGSGRTIRLWNPATGSALSRSRHVCWLPWLPWLPSSQLLELRLWLLHQQSARAPVSAMTAVRLATGEVRLVVAAGHAIQLWRVTADGDLRRVRGVRALHDGPVRDVAGLTWPDGHVVVASGGDDATVRLWDPATGNALRDPMVGHHGPVRALAVHTLPEGTPLLVSGGADGTLRTWDLARGAQDGNVMVATGAPLRAIATVTASEPVVASADADGVLRLWDCVARKERQSIRLGIAITSLAGDHGILYAGSANGLIALDTQAKP